MLQNEWTDRTAHEPTAAEWETITTVYAFHPAIPDVAGKDKLAAIFAVGGMGIIADMLPAARRGKAAEDNMAATFRAVQQARAALAAAEAAHEQTAAEWRALLAEYGRG